MNNKTFLENLLKEINEDNVIHEAPELVKNPLDKNNNGFFTNCGASRTTSSLISFNKFSKNVLLFINLI